MRFKLAAVIVVIFGAVGATIYFNVSDNAQQQAVTSLDAQLLGARQSVVQRRTLRDFAILDKASRVASWPQLAAVLKKAPSDFVPEGEEGAAVDPKYKRHQDMNDEVLVWKERFKDFAERKTVSRSLTAWARAVPSYFVVVDKVGVVISDARDPAEYGKSITTKYPSLEDTLKEGRRVRDLWWIGAQGKGAAMAIGAVPVRDRDSKILGAVIIGYRLNDAEARREQVRVQAHVAYLISGKLKQSSSLVAGLEADLETQLNQQVSKKEKEKGLFSAKLKGEKYRVHWRRLSGYESAETYVAVLKSEESFVRSAKAGLLMVPMLILFGTILCVILAMFLVQRLVAPFMDIDQGVLEIINGNLDYWFEPESGDVATNMAQNLNIMVCQLSGRPLPDEDDDAVRPQNWVQDQLFVESIDDQEVDASTVAASVMNTSQMAGLSSDMIALIRDDDSTYHQKTFDAYSAALEETGESKSNLTRAAFTAQLEQNAAQLKERYGCQRVRFLVEIENGRAALKPVPMD